MTKYIDLHIHSTASDGSYSPSKLVEMAKEINLTAIALTDHDTIDGIPEFCSKAKEMAIEAIPAVEIGVKNERDRGLNEVHLLGYFIDSDDSPVGKALKKLQKSKNDWSKKQLKVLAKGGFDIDYETIVQISKGSPTIRRPHIWQAIAQKYGNTLAREDYYTNTSSGGKWCVEKSLSYSIEEAIELVLQSKGIPVLAHPAFCGNWNKLNQTDKNTKIKLPDEVLNVINIAKKAGVCGIETVYAYNSTGNKTLPDEQIIGKLLAVEAQKLNLCQTGGSDFHGEISKSVKLGEAKVPTYFLAILKEKYTKIHGIKL